MQGLMQDVPLAIPHIFERAEKYHPHKEIVTATGAGAVWLSSRVLPLDASGHGAILNQTLAVTQRLADKLQRSFDNIHFTPGRQVRRRGSAQGG